jgi:carbonic anhydrase/acetyltransferase-like protein (isoleucine patch superfamily)
MPLFAAIGICGMPIYSLGAARIELRGGRHFIAPSASLIGAVILDHEANIWFDVVIRADNDTIAIGAGTNVQDGSVLHVDAGIPMTLGRGVSVGHKAMLHGCTIGDGALIGMNAVVMNGCRIGRNALIGANALLPEGKEVPDGMLAVGSPAKVIRPLNEAELSMLARLPEGYIRRAQRYLRELQEA